MVINTHSDFTILLRNGYYVSQPLRVFSVTKKPASIYLRTSSLILRAISGWNLLNFCLSGGHSSFIGSRCSTMSASNPGISLYDHAKMLEYSLRSSTNLSLTFASNKAPILISFLSYLVPKLIISISSWWGSIAFLFCSSIHLISSGISSSSSTIASYTGNSKLGGSIGLSCSTGSCMFSLHMIYEWF